MCSSCAKHNILTYKNFKGFYHYDEEKNAYCCEIEGMEEKRVFSTRTLAALESTFHSSVDGYLAFCWEITKG